jgi:hypothetical protein
MTEWIAVEIERMTAEMGELETEISSQRHKSEDNSTPVRGISSQKVNEQDRENERAEVE